MKLRTTPLLLLLGSTLLLGNLTLRPGVAAEEGGPSWSPLSSIVSGEKEAEMKTAKWKLPVFLVGLALMFCIESIFPRRQWETARGKRFLFHLGLAVLNSFLLRLFLVVLPLGLLAFKVRALGWGVAPMLGLKGPVEIIFSLIVLDFLDYWWHRWNHRVPLFWRFHKVHHSDTHCDTITSLRFHIGEFLISSVMKAGWIVFWGPSVWAFAIFEASISLASQFHHSNIDFPDKVERAIRFNIVTPRYHASHHTVARRTGDNNFSTIFIWWDKIFGTYEEPDEEELKTLGLAGGRARYLSYKSTLAAPFTDEY